MLERYEPSGPYLTRAYAAYPAELNKALAEFVAKHLDPARSPAPSAHPVAEESMQLDTQLEYSNRLKPRDAVQATNMEQWSLRNIHRSMTGRSLIIGKQISNLIERELDRHPEVEPMILDNIGRAPEEVVYPTDWIDKPRSMVAGLLQRNKLDEMPDICLTEKVCNKTYNTVIRGHFLEYWANVTQDPASFAAAWLYQGAPAGLESDIKLDGICAPVENDAPELDEDVLTTDLENFHNYSGVEDNDEAVKAIHGYRDKGYLMEFNTIEEATDSLGHQPTLSKLGCIVKERKNPETGEVTTKTRIILDCKQSMVSKYAARSYKSALPRVSDAVACLLKLLSSVAPGQGNVTMYIADVMDAFWLIPLKQEERRYFAAKLRGKIYVFHRTAQGSRGAPLTFSVVMGLLARFVQSLIGNGDSCSAQPEGYMQVYVDDPLVMLRGGEDRLKRLTCIVSIGWLLMGVPLAFHKATLSSTVTWVGVTISVSAAAVEVEVPTAKVAELMDLVTEVLSGNVVPVKLLRTVIGKCMAIASVIYVWRPFVQELYASLQCTGNAPANCVWTRQVQHTLFWIYAFLKQERGSITRIYDVQQYRGAGDLVDITWDASPYGMGAFLSCNGDILEFFAIGISENDQTILGTKSGTSEGQQLWECLSGLIAMRLWTRWWQCKRARLRLRSDNISALTLFSQLKSHSRQLAIIAREFSLDLGAATFKPEIAQHLPGVSNVIADMLSRRYQPGKTFQLHPSLLQAKAVIPPTRDRTWWKTLAEPPMPVKPLADTRAWAPKRAKTNADHRANTALAPK